MYKNEKTIIVGRVNVSRNTKIYYRPTNEGFALIATLICDKFEI